MRSIIALVCALAASVAMSAPAPYPLTINSQSQTAPELTVYRGNYAAFRVSFYDGTNRSNIGGQVPIFTWSTNASASTVATSSYAVVSAASGVVDFAFSTTNLNWTPGRYIYEVGLLQSNGAPSVYRQGAFVIRGSPYGQGGSLAALATNEVDPAFRSSAAYGITAADTAQWAAAGVNGAAYTNWAATNNWSTRITDAQATADIATNWQATTTLVRVESDPVWAGVSGVVSVGASAGSAAFAWGNHATNGYVTQTVTNGLQGAGEYVTASITNGLQGAGNYATGTPVYAESDPVFTNWLSTNSYIEGLVSTSDVDAEAYSAFANVAETDGRAMALLAIEVENRQDTDANIMQAAFRIAKLENESEFDLADGYSATFQTATVGTNSDLSTYAVWNAGEYYEGKVAGGAGQALFLDGTGDYATNAAAGFAVTNDLTVAWWVRPEESDNAVMLAFADLNGNWRGIFAQRNADESLVFWTSDGRNNMENTWAGVIPQDAWTHLAVVISNSESIIILYTNGVLAEAKSISMLPSQPPAGTPFVVGMYPLGAGHNLLGSLDQIVAWNRCLTEAEIADVYAGTLASSPTLLLEYDGDPNDSSSFASPGELKADATYTNGATTSMAATNMTLALKSYSTINVVSNLVGTAFLSGTGYDATNYSLVGTANAWTNSIPLGIYKATQYKAGEYIVTATGTTANAGTTVAVKLVTTNNAAIKAHGMMIQTDR